MIHKNFNFDFNFEAYFHQLKTTVNENDTSTDCEAEYTTNVGRISHDS